MYIDVVFFLFSKVEGHASEESVERENEGTPLGLAVNKSPAIFIFLRAPDYCYREK